MLGAEVVHPPRSRLQTFRLGDDKMLGHAGFETVLRVAEVQFVPVSQELLYHSIPRRNEFDDEVGLEACKPGDQVRERHVPTDSQMVYERERQD